MEKIGQEFVITAFEKVFESAIQRTNDCLCLDNPDSVEKDKLIAVINESSFDQGKLLEHLYLLEECYGAMKDIKIFYDWSKEYYYYNKSKMEMRESLSVFVEMLTECSSDEERIRLINDEIHLIRSEQLEGNLYTENPHLEDAINRLKKMQENLIQKTQMTQHIRNLNTSNEQVNVKGNPEEDQENILSTMQQTIALYYLINEISPDNLAYGNKKNMSRFIHALINKSEPNVYKNLQRMLKDVDNLKGQLKKDFEIIIKLFDDYDLGAISKKIRSDIS